MDWYALSQNELIWLCNLENQNVTFGSYKSMFHYYAFQRPPEYPEDMISIQGCAPLHHVVEVLQYLDQMFQNRWMAEPVQFPATASSSSHTLQLCFMGISERYCVPWLPGLNTRSRGPSFTGFSPHWQRFFHQSSVKWTWRFIFRKSVPRITVQELEIM